MYMLAVVDEATGTPVRPATEEELHDLPQELVALEGTQGLARPGQPALPLSSKNMSLSELLAAATEAQGQPICNHCGAQGGCNGRWLGHLPPWPPPRGAPIAPSRPIAAMSAPASPPQRPYPRFRRMGSGSASLPTLGPHSNPGGLGAAESAGLGRSESAPDPGIAHWTRGASAALPRHRLTRPRALAPPPISPADSPQWRKGPEDKPVLCNACGTRYRCAKKRKDGHLPFFSTWLSRSPPPPPGPAPIRRRTNQLGPAIPSDQKKRPLGGICAQQAAAAAEKMGRAGKEPRMAMA